MVAYRHSKAKRCWLVANTAPFAPNNKRSRCFSLYRQTSTVLDNGLAFSVGGDARMAEEKRYPIRLTERPRCALTEHWEESRDGDTIVRYGGADGHLYERITPEGGRLFWLRLGRRIPKGAVDD